MYDVFLGYDSKGCEIWIDYEWLRKGCIDEQHFNWFYSLFTAQNPDIQQLQKEGTQFRKFTSSIDFDDFISHEKKWELIDIEGFKKFDFKDYIKQKWGL